MGVDISDLVEGKKIALEDLSGRSIAIDAFNTLYQFLSMIRQPDGTPLMDRDGRVTSHLSGLFYRSAALLELGIRPAFVFDGKPPELKKKTLEERRAVKETAEREWKKAIEEGDLKKALSKASRTSRLDSAMIEESLSLLDALGIPWIRAPSEGEAQMAHMVRKGDVWAGASQDFDAILFGTPNLVRNLTLSGKRRLPSGKTVEVNPVMVTLAEVLSALGVSREQLVDMAVLMGTDFNEGIKGIGPKKALAIIKKAGNLERVVSEGKFSVPKEYGDIRRLFLEPEVTDDYRLLWGIVDDEGVRKIMCDKHGFSVDRIDSILAKISVTGSAKSQKSLDSWS
ncbi:MAG: flap endonuclease-1 [Euryarchaeota archaeon RBG_13_57_23]|nr:MAG: flap endonuclease-1 [Euryarchaeota archaeon RBG_13_57_23]